MNYREIYVHKIINTGYQYGIVIYSGYAHG